MKEHGTEGRTIGIYVLILSVLVLVSSYAYIQLTVVPIEILDVPDTMMVEVQGSVGKSYYEITPNEYPTTPSYMLYRIYHDYGVNFTISQGQLISIGYDSNSRSMQWNIYINGYKTTLQDTILEGDSISFMYEPLMEVYP